MTTFDCVLDARAGLGEGAVWSERDQILWWVEILERRIHCFDPSTGDDRVYEAQSCVGCVAPRAMGGLAAALEEGIVLFDDNIALRSVIPGTAPGPGRRFNDGTVSPEGRFLATTMAKVPPFDAPEQNLLVFDSGMAGTRVVERGLMIGNGLAFSPDGGTLYLADSHPDRSCVWAYDWDADDGVASGRRLFFDGRDQPGVPDGAAVDVDGCYWFAASHGWRVVRLTPDGRIDRVIPVPVQKPTKVAFGGAALDTLYLTSIGANLMPGTEGQQPQAGGLFACMPGVQGLASPQYAG